MIWRDSKLIVVQISVICTLLAAAPAPGEDAGEGCGYLPNPRCALRAGATPSTARAGNVPTDRRLLPRRAAIEQKSWTLLFYDDADFTPGYDPFNSFASETASGEHLDVLVLRDTYGGPAEVYHIGEDHQATLIAEWGEINMGEWQTLRDFVAEAKASYPADRFFLALYDHGGGWRGACRDDTDGGSMSMNDMQRALDEAGPIDIIAFTAPCLMGALESAYELRNNVGFYIGSEDYSGYVYWRGIFDEITEMLDSQPQQSSAAVSEAVIDLVARNLMPPPQYRATLTMSAVDTLELQVAVNTFDSVCAEIVARGSTMMDALGTARERVKTFAEQPDINGTIDAVDFIDQLISATGSEEMHDDLTQLRDELGRAIINEHHGSAHEGAGGLTVYFPTHPLYVSTAYRTDGLDFVDQTSWLDVIAAVHAVKRPRWRTGVPGGRVP